MKPTYSSSNSCSCTVCMERNQSEHTSSFRIGTDDSKNERNFKKYDPPRKRSLLQNTKPTYGDFKYYHYFDTESSQFTNLQWTRPCKKQHDNVIKERSAAVLELVNLVDKGSTLGSRIVSACCSDYSYSTIGNYHAKTVRKNGKCQKTICKRSSGLGRHSTSASSISKLKGCFKTKHIRSAPCTCTFIKNQTNTIINKLRAHNRFQVNKSLLNKVYRQESESKDESNQTFDSGQSEKRKHFSNYLEKHNLKNSKELKYETDKSVEKFRIKRRHHVADVQTNTKNKLKSDKQVLPIESDYTIPKHVDKSVNCTSRNNKIKVTYDNDHLMNTVLSDSKSGTSIASTISFDKMTAVNVKATDSVAINVATLKSKQSKENNLQRNESEYKNKDTVISNNVKSMSYLPIVSSKVSSESTSTCSYIKMKTEKLYYSKPNPTTEKNTRSHQPLKRDDFDNIPVESVVCNNRAQQWEPQKETFQKYLKVPSYQNTDMEFSSSSYTSKGMQSQITQADLSSRSNGHQEQTSKKSSFKLKTSKHIFATYNRSKTINKNAQPFQVEKCNSSKSTSQLNDLGCIEWNICQYPKLLREHEKITDNKLNTLTIKSPVPELEKILLLDKTNLNNCTKVAKALWVEDAEKNNVCDRPQANPHQNNTTETNKKQRNVFSDIFKQYFSTFKFNTFAKSKKRSKEVVANAAIATNHEHSSMKFLPSDPPMYKIGQYKRQSNVYVPEKRVSCSYTNKQDNRDILGEFKIGGGLLKKQFIAAGTAVNDSEFVPKKNIPKISIYDSNTCHYSKRGKNVITCDSLRSEVKPSVNSNVVFPIVTTPPNDKDIQNNVKLTSNIITDSKDTKRTQKSGIQIILKKCLRSLAFGKKEVHHNAEHKGTSIELENINYSVWRSEVPESLTQCPLRKDTSLCVLDNNLNKNISKEKEPHRLFKSENVNFSSKQKLPDMSLNDKQGLPDLECNKFIHESLDNLVIGKNIAESINNHSPNKNRYQNSYFSPFSRQYVTMNVLSTRENKKDCDHKHLDSIQYEYNPEEHKKTISDHPSASSSSNTTTEKNHDKEVCFGYRIKDNSVKAVKQHISYSNSYRQDVREEPNISLNLRLRKKLYPDDTNSTQSQSKISKKYNIITPRQKNRDYMDSKSQVRLPNTGLSPILKKCYCTLELKKNSKQEINVIKTVSHGKMNAPRKINHCVYTQGTTTSSEDIGQEFQSNSKKTKFSKRQYSLGPQTYEANERVTEDYCPVQNLKRIRISKRYPYREFTAKTLAHSAATVTVHKATKRRKQIRSKYLSAQSLRKKTDQYISPKRQVVKIGSSFSFSIEFSRTLPPVESKSHKRVLRRTSTGTITDTDTRHGSSQSGNSNKCFHTLMLRNQSKIPEIKCRDGIKRRKEKDNGATNVKDHKIILRPWHNEEMYAKNVSDRQSYGKSAVKKCRHFAYNSEEYCPCEDNTLKQKEINTIKPKTPYLQSRRRIYNVGSKTGVGLTNKEGPAKTTLKRCYCTLSLQKPSVDMLKTNKRQAEYKTLHHDAKSLKEIKTNFLRPSHSASFSSTLDSSLSLGQNKSQSTSVHSRLPYNDEFEKMPMQLDSFIKLNAISSENIFNYLINERYSVANKLRNREDNETKFKKTNTDLMDPRQKLLNVPGNLTSLTGMSPFLKSNVYAYKVTKEKAGKGKGDKKKIPKNLQPYECEPGVCIPGECNPEECLKRIQERNKRLKISGKHGKTPVERKDLPDLEPYASRNMQTITPKHRNSKCGPTRYLVETPRFHKGVSMMPRGLRVTSSVKLNIELYRDALPPIGHRPPPPYLLRREEYTQVEEDYEERKTGDGICFKHRGLQTPQYRVRDSGPVSQGVGTGYGAVKRCFCTLKLLKSPSDFALIETKHQTTSADIEDEPKYYDRNISAQFPMPISQADTGVGTAKKDKDNPCDKIECEPGTCIPGECDPKECLKRIKRRRHRQHREQQMMNRRHQMQNIPEDSHVVCGDDPDDEDLERPAVRFASEIGFETEFYSENPYSMRKRSRDRRQMEKELKCRQECPPPKPTREKSTYDSGAPRRDHTSQSVPQKETKGTNILRRCFCTLKLANPNVHYMSVDVNSPLYVENEGNLYEVYSNRSPETYKRNLNDLKYIKNAPVYQNPIHKVKYIKRDERPVVSYAQFQIPPRVITVGRVAVEKGDKKYVTKVVNKNSSRYKINPDKNKYLKNYMRNNKLESEYDYHEIETIYPYTPRKLNNNASKTLTFKNQSKCEFYSFPIYKLSSRCRHVMKTENRRHIKNTDKRKDQKKKLRSHLTGQKKTKKDYDAERKMRKALNVVAYLLEKSPATADEKSSKCQDELKHTYTYLPSRHVPLKVDKRDRYPRAKKHNHIKVYRPDVLKYVKERRTIQLKTTFSEINRKVKMAEISERDRVNSTKLPHKYENHRNVQSRFSNMAEKTRDDIKKMKPKIYRRDSLFCYYQTQYRPKKMIPTLSNKYDKDKCNTIREVSYSCPLKRHTGSKLKPTRDFSQREVKKKTSNIAEEIEHKPSIYKSMCKFVITADTPHNNKFSFLNDKNLAAICKLTERSFSMCHLLKYHHPSLSKNNSNELTDEVYVKNKAANMRSKRLKHRPRTIESEIYSRLYKKYIGENLFCEPLKTPKKTRIHNIHGTKKYHQDAQQTKKYKKPLYNFINRNSKENRVNKKKHTNNHKKRQKSSKLKKRSQINRQRKPYHVTEKEYGIKQTSQTDFEDAVIDVGKFGFSILRSFLKKIAHTYDTIRSIKKYSQELLPLHRSHTRSLLMHILDTNPKSRLKLMKKHFLDQRMLCKCEPLDFECPLMHQKRQSLKMRNMCPLFSPHFIGVLKVWRYFSDVLLFILAVVVWSPCILCTNLYRALKFCTACTA